MDDFNTIVNISYSILENKNLEYQISKRLISKVFEEDNNNTFETTYLRLTVIDSFYATQMSKRLYGMYDLANTLAEKSDKEWIGIAKSFIFNPEDENNDIAVLMKQTFGFEKDAKNKKRAISLISKYFYFLTKYKFPIFDSLASEAIKKLVKAKIIDEISINESNYFEKIIHLKKKYEIDSFNKLDNCLWLLGKIGKGSISSLLTKKEYEDLLKVIEVKFDDKGTKTRDEYIKEKIFNNLDKLESAFMGNKLFELLKRYKENININH